ncbi:ATP-binding protein [Streptomyces sp. NPDC051287]|uniref:ATP-binding protein n=1 Tax=Streptomyces sp. NPDC051287 TaxID=3365648 RepID=UPI00378D6CF0
MSACEVPEGWLRCVLPFEAAPAEVPLLRRAAVRQLGRWGLPAVTDEAALLVTELATNVFKHVGEGVSATLILEWRGERLRVEVHDKSRVVPTLRSAECDAECGRGLHLLTALAADWGTVLTSVGKGVWCEIPLSAGKACPRIERGAEALESYRGRQIGRFGRVREAGLDEAAVELIADLLHWSAACGRDPDDVLDRAQMRYEAEAEAVA